ncbi:MAG TPA: dUTP diphosphatase [Aggregatilineales bacterium]|nr:dUTP diphosphatase [Aggregatilineales bacterium]
MRVYVNETFLALGLTLTAPRPGDAGYDLYAVETLQIVPGGRGLIPTGVHVEIPEGYVGLVKDRSSMALKGLHTMAGVVDAGYRGEIKIVLLNTTGEPVTIDAGQKVAQMIVVPVYTQALETVESLEALSATERGAGGFGSTGR